MSRLDKLLKTISLAPQVELDAALALRVKHLQGGTNEIVATELKEILGLCMSSDRASRLAIMIISEAIIIAETKD